MAAPLVISTTPANGATDVEVKSTVVFVFSERLDPTTVHASTVLLYLDDTGEKIEGAVSLSADKTTVLFRPDKGLREETLYSAFAVGASDGMPGGNIKAEDGTDLADTYQIGFRTKIERYGRLTEVSDRDDILDVGPIREDDPILAATGYLDIESTTPAGFASNIERTLSEIKVCFGETVLPTGAYDALELTLQNVLGLEEYYGEGAPHPPDPSGRYLLDWLQADDPRRDLFDVDPSGTVAVSGQCAIWTKHSGSPDFHYNTEVIVRVRSDAVTNATGQMLEEDVYFTFTTEYWPLYVGVEYIRLQLGRAISDLFDDTIRRHIHANSIDAIDYAAACFDTEHPYPNVRRYVRSATILAILDELGILGVLQSGSKQLGDLRIDWKPQDIAKVMTAYKRAQKEYDASKLELYDYRRLGTPRSTVKGSANARERQDYYMRTWQHLRDCFVPAANMTEYRRVKSLMSTDHPSLDRVYFYGYADERRVAGSAFPWWINRSES